MGNLPSFDHRYSVPVPGGKDIETQTPTLRAATHPDALVSSMAEKELKGGWDLFQFGMQGNREAPFLGRRKALGDGKFGEFEWLTFAQVEHLALTVGTALIERGCVPVREFPNELFEGARKMRLLGIFSKNRVEWFIAEQGSNAYGVTIVPLYDTLGPDVIDFIISETNLGCSIVSGECLESLMQAASKADSMTHIVCLDDVTDEQRERCRGFGTELITWSELLKFGESLPKLPPIEVKKDDVNTLCYTSGTTSRPKGVLITQGGLASEVCAAVRGPMSAPSLVVTAADIHISYLPLAHVFERAICGIVMSKGAKIAVYSGDTQKLLDDVKELRPTIFISVPRLYNRINDKVNANLKGKPALLQYLFNSGMNAKIESLRRDGTLTHPIWDKLVFNKTKLLMGGRLRYMVVGGAPLDAAIQERMKVLFGCPLMEGYGLTETMGGSFIGAPCDPLSGHVGGPVPCLECRLESVTEMDYHARGTPPAGELLLRGTSLAAGYFKNPEEWKKAVDEDGWFHTGDVVVMLPSGAFKIVDRKKNIFKLAQGEYVAPEKIENVYLQSLMVGQIFVFGYSSQAVLVAIVVPDEEQGPKWAAANGAPTDLEELVMNAAFKKVVMEDMDITAKQNGLKGFEKVKDIHLISDAFTTENDLLTPTMKLKRHQIKEKYLSDIDAMYASLNKK